MVDLREKDPSRGGNIDRTNVVFTDIVDCLIEASGHLERFQAMGESRFGMVANQSLDKIISTAELLKRRINDIRKDINDRSRHIE